MQGFYEIDESYTNVDSKTNLSSSQISTAKKDEDEYIQILEYIKSNDVMSKKKKLVEFTRDLNRLELMEIFYIFKKYECSYTENTNGIFINITNVSEEVINRVYTFIAYIKEKKRELNQYENMLNVEKDKIKDVNKLNEENLDNYIFNKNFIHQMEEKKMVEVLSDNDEEVIYQLDLSSDEDEDLENKLSLKKKKIKYTGTKAKIIKSYKENKDGIFSHKKKGSKEKEENTENA
jgi:hypothetical protein